MLKESYFHLFIGADADYYPLFALASAQRTNTSKTVVQDLYDYIQYYSNLEEFSYYWKDVRCMEVFVNKIPTCTVVPHPGGKPYEYTPESYTIYLLYFDSREYYYIQFKCDDHAKRAFHFAASTIEINIPPINQLAGYYEEPLRTYPAGLRNVVMSDRPQYSVNKTFRGRQSIHISSIRALLLAFKREVQDDVIDLYFSDEMSVNPVITVRIDLNRTDINKTSIYTGGAKDLPLYATLRFPPQTLLLTYIVSGSRGGNVYTYDPDQFESNIIYANAGMAAAFIGGGMLSGIGQGIGAYAQSKFQKEMQEQYLDWKEDYQQREFLNRRSMQGDMFSFQEKQQDKNLSFQKYSLAENLKFQEEYQRQQYIQQDLYQYRQNEFTKELVEANADSSIRQARNAQQLAGYRTDAAVSGLSMGIGRGGLGHPLAPQGAPLPPRSVSTQTYSPKLNLAQPSGYYTGPSESVI